MCELNLNALLGEQYPSASFHDSRMHTLHLDYETRVAQITCTLYIGGPGMPTEAMREATADGLLSFSGLLYCVIEPPHPDSTYEDGSLDISSEGSVATTQFTSPLPNLPDVPDEAFLHWFFVNNWNTRVFIAATDAQFVWT